MPSSHPLRLLGGSLLAAALLVSPLAAQFRGAPGGAPGGGGGPRPGGGPQPAQPFNPNPQPWQPGNPHPGQPNMPGMPGQPGHAGGYPQGPQPGGWSVRNPFAPQSPAFVPGGPVPVGRVPVPTPVGAAGAGEWQQAQAQIRAGNVAAAQQAVEAQLRQNPSLTGVMSAVSAFEQARAPAAATQALRTQALQMAQAQISQGASQPLPYIAVAKFSLEDHRDQEFRQAAQVLMDRYPNSEYAHYFAGVRQIQDGDYPAAEASLRRARELGMPEEGLADLLRIAIDNQRWVWQYAYATFVILAVWLVGLVGLFAAGKTLSALTLRSLHHAGAEVVTPFDRRLRQAYRVVINLAGLYYYGSLPVVVLQAIALPLSLGYAMLLVPYLNLGLVVLVLVLGFGGVLTALSGLRAAFARVKDREIGEAVTADESPRLWAVAREVADRVGTRCVDEIRVTPSTEVAVVERGSFLQRLNDRGRRVLVVGLGAAQGMKLDALKCILAHEYGHFHNRDTAGGDVALRVYQAMQQFAAAIIRRGKAHWWDVAVHFLRGYHFLFRRLTFGASRLQEVLADRVAVRTYGRAAFEEGLTHVIRRSVEFEVAVNRAVRDTLRNARPSLAFYTPGPLELGEREQVEEVVRKILGRRTDQNDSHPSPKDRFEMAARLDPEERPLGPDTAWELLAENGRLLTAMSQLVDHLVGQEVGQVQAAQARAVRFLSAVLSRGPHAEAYAERGRIHHQQGDLDQALTDLNEALRLRPSNPGMLCSRALVHKAQKRYAAAVEDLNWLEVHEPYLTPDDRFGLNMLRGHCLAQVGRHEEAVRAFSAALEARPESLAALIERGQSHMQSGQDAQALQDFSAAVEHWPTSPEAHEERARAQAALAAAGPAALDPQAAPLGPQDAAVPVGEIVEVVDVQPFWPSGGA